jgi:hypothetical protein
MSEENNQDINAAQSDPLHCKKPNQHKGIKLTEKTWVHTKEKKLTSKTQLVEQSKNKQQKGIF